MYALHYRKNFDTPEDYICIANGSLIEMIKQRMVSGDLVVNTSTKKVVNSKAWLFDWEKVNSTCYAQKAIQNDHGTH